MITFSIKNLMLYHKNNLDLIENDDIVFMIWSCIILILAFKNKLKRIECYHCIIRVKSFDLILFLILL